MQQMEKLQIFKRLFDFSKWLLNHTNKFPKSHRFTVAVKMENAVLEMIELITKANLQQNKMKFLILADEKLMFLKIMARLSFEMQFLSSSSYEYAGRELLEIGKMLGGWMKQQTAKA